MNANENTIYVLVDEPTDLAKFGGPKEIDADQLGAQLQKFSDAVSQAVGHCKKIAGDFQLDEITLEAKFSAEFGFMFVSKAGVEGAVTLKFARA
ncbi:MAG: hypothetical protein JWN34_1505 [Bryobacterales bacterium]|nr:hypothetical protein [Bryobacterales bacterium]